MKGYNGWKNWETWNVSLWVNNDEYFYRMSRRFVSWDKFAKALKDQGITKTPDGASYTDPSLDIDALDEMLNEV